MNNKPAAFLRNCAAFVAASFMLLSCTAQPSKPDAVYYLVRHAEKQLDVKDPPLTAKGKERAQDLTDRLFGVTLTAIYSTDYVRTQDTAAPVAAAKGLKVQSYDPSDLPGFAKTLLGKKGHILVSGHSNTTPQLAELLGADPGEPIIEATEYNRLYIIERKDADVIGLIQTFGK